MQACLAAVFFAALAAAHPMGNFSISHYTGLHVRENSVDVRYVIDMAEIPTFQEMQQSGMTAETGGPRLEAYLASKATELAEGLVLTVNGHALPLQALSHQVIFPLGAGDLRTMKTGFLYRAALPASCRGGVCALEYRDANFEGRTGWKEIVTSLEPSIHAEGVAPSAIDRSSALTNYPTDLLNSPPQDLTLKFAFVTVARPMVRHEPTMQTVVPPLPPPPLNLTPNRQSPPRNAFTELMAHKEISFGFALIAAIIAAGLGALHALEPGHGKTIVAAYLVGSKGTARHAFLLGLIVTVSHTAGVYLLGGVTLYAQKYIMPDRLYPYLSVISGILIAGMGLYVFLKRFMGEDFLDSHGPGGHSHGMGKIGNRQIMILGVTGGMVPCPAALVVLLSAVALHRVGFGLFLIVAFSMGLAAVLIGMGLATVYAGRLLSRVAMEGPLVRVWMPAASAAMIIILGFTIAIRGLMAAGIV